jgi:hypothetical protein
MAIRLSKNYETLKAMAEGRAAFRVMPYYEKLAELEQREHDALPAQERLDVGLYLTAKRRYEMLRADERMINR